MNLIVTNGQSGIDAIKNAGIEGEVFSWDDVLHDGPVPGGYALDVLSELRARFIASEGEGDFEVIHAAFTARDQKLASAAEYEELVLFFEHDLYDQLQLIQVLSLLAEEIKPPSRITLVHPPTFIGWCTPEQLQQSFKERLYVEEKGIEQGARAWEAFTDESPVPVADTAQTLRSSVLMPHLSTSLWRLAEEYPNYMSDLSRTESQILEVLQTGELLSFGEVFNAVQEKEEAAFMGDWSFAQYLGVLAGGDQPLVECYRAKQNGIPGHQAYAHADYSITPAGLAVLRGEAGKSDYLEIDRWIGGVHINEANFWRWIPEQQVFVR